MKKDTINEYHFVRFDCTDTKIIEAPTLVEGYVKMLKELGWEWIACVAEDPKYSVYKVKGERKEWLMKKIDLHERNKDHLCSCGTHGAITFHTIEILNEIVDWIQTHEKDYKSWRSLVKTIAEDKIRGRNKKKH